MGIVLNKFGQLLQGKNNMILYHGINKKMMLNPTQTFSFYGPLSTTSSEHVAKSFATPKGMVLKITSQFPRLGKCNAFDASQLSDYPEEQEWLVGFMYMRILQISTKKLINEFKSFENLLGKVPLSSWMRQEFTAIHLFQQQMYSMSENLELMLAQYLRVNRRECCDKNVRNKYSFWKKNDYKAWNERMDHLCLYAAKHRKQTKQEAKSWKSMQVNDVQRKDISRMMKLYPVLWKKFNHFRESQTVIRFDMISDNLKTYFMEPINVIDIKTNEKKMIVSFDEIIRVYPNAKELIFLNEYKFDSHILRRLINQIKKKDNQLEKVSFSYFRFKENAKTHSINMSESLMSYQAAVYGNSDLDLSRIKQIEQYTSNGSTEEAIEEEIFFKDSLLKKRLYALGWKMSLEQVKKIYREAGEKIAVYKVMPLSSH